MNHQPNQRSVAVALVCVLGLGVWSCSSESDGTQNQETTESSGTGGGDGATPPGDDSPPPDDSGSGGSTGTGGDGSTMNSTGGASSATGGNDGTGGGLTDQKPFFSFFTTSEKNLIAEAEAQGRGTEGFGGDLGGLSGADALCTKLAQIGNPGDSKTWRAFLSTTGKYGDMVKEDAIDRIGPGPWYDFNGRLFAENVNDLIAEIDDSFPPPFPQTGGRPKGDPQLAEMFTDEMGLPIRPHESVDNHDMLTGSGYFGRLFDRGDSDAATCNDWTSTAPRASLGIPVGHAWPRSDQAGRNWTFDHTINGCEPSVNTGLSGGAGANDFGVGAGGGYGGFYCFALGAVAP